MHWPLVLGLSILTTGALAETWRWTDADGNVHFSDSPPPEGIEAQRIEDTGAPAQVPPPEEDSVLQRQQRALEILEEQAREREKALEARARERKIQRQRECNDRKRELIEVRESGPLLTDDFPGVRYRQQKEKERRIEALEEWIDENCS